MTWYTTIVLLTVIISAIGVHTNENLEFLVMFGVTKCTKEHNINNVCKYCTGSLIKPTWVLTGAYCLMKEKITTDLRVYRGDFCKFPNISSARVKNMFPNELYRINALESIKEVVDKTKFVYNPKHDIGLAVIEQLDSCQDLKFGVLSAVDFNSLVGYSVKYVEGELNPEVAGEETDKTRRLNTKVPLKLSEGVVGKCEKIEVAIGNAAPTNDDGAFLCLRVKCTNADPMSPSSGSPLLFMEKIVGVAVGGLQDTNSIRYIPVSPYFDWIRHVIASVGEDKFA